MNALQWAVCGWELDIVKMVLEFWREGDINFIYDKAWAVKRRVWQQWKDVQRPEHEDEGLDSFNPEDVYYRDVQRAFEERLRQ